MDEQNTCLSHSDYECLGKLIDQHMQVTASDIKWMKLLSGFTLTLLGGGIALLWPIVAETHRIIDDVKIRVMILERNDIENKDVNEKVLGRRSDHNKCHFGQVKK